jgi:hypothetical protein
LVHRRVVIALSSQEKALYEPLFAQLSKGSGSVQGAEIVFLRGKTGQPDGVLSQAWIASCGGKSFLSQQDFYLMLRLIAMAQSGITPDPVQARAASPGSVSSWSCFSAPSALWAQ